jgi:hypothetical protein
MIELLTRQKELKNKMIPMKIFYKGYWIIPGSWKKFQAVHKDYDGNEDRRIFEEDTIKACKLAIEEFHDGKEYLPSSDCKICGGSGYNPTVCTCWGWR